MTRKALHTFFACLTLILCGHTAQAAPLIIGYCDGEIAEKGVGKTGIGTISAAVCFPQEMLSQYAGTQITGIRVGLTTAENVTELVGWVRTDLTGSDVAYGTFDTQVTGWNETDFDTPYTIDGNSDLYLGFSFTQQLKQAKCISLVGKPSQYGYFLAKDNEWQDKGLESDGVVSIEMYIEGDNLPATDLTIESCTFDNNVQVSGSTFKASCVVRNMASTPIEGYDLSYQINGGESLQITGENRLEYRQRDTLYIEIPATAVPLGVSTLSTSVATKGNLTDENLSNNSIETPFATYDTPYNHIVLLEQFTSEECPNCPRGIFAIDEAMKVYGNKVIHVAHHSGYKDDWLTIDDSDTYVWLYGPDGSFAPAKMLDRHRISDEYPVESIADAADVISAIETVLPNAALVEAKPVVQYDENTREAQITVTCNKLDAFDVQCPEARLTLFLVEDSVKAVDQAGISSSTFKHANVVRDVASNDVWGDIIPWNGNEATIVYTVTIPEDWDETRMTAVVFVSHYNPDDRNDCNVYNAAKWSFNTPEAVESTRTNKEVSHAEYYSIQGFRLLSEPTEGIYITRIIYTDGSIDVKKCATWR